MMEERVEHKSTHGETFGVETRRKLLEAAGEVFAEHGFKNATVREIAQKAGANIAAINYHFGDKFALYKSVLRFFSNLGMEKYPPHFGVGPDAEPDIKLYAFVRTFFLRMYDPGKPAYVSRLILQEMVDPTDALDERIRDMIHPMLTLLKSIIREIVKIDLSEEQMFMACSSTIGQILFHRHCAPVVAKIFPKQTPYSTELIDRLSRHVTEFSLAGLNDMQRRELIARNKECAK